MKIALAQMDIKWEDKNNNKIKAEFMAEKAKNKNADFIIFPETTLTGFSFNTEKTAEKHENSDTINFFKAIGSRLGLNICFGAIIKEANNYYNKSFVIRNDSEIISDYSKLYPFSYSGEDKFFKKGSKIVNYTLEDINFLSCICYDLRFPELFRSCCEKIHAAVVIANWPESRRNHWLSLLRARAIENQCYIIAVNRIGNGNGISYCGDSAVFNPNGDMILNCGDKEDVFFCDIFKNDVIEYRKSFPVLKDKRDLFTI